MKNKKQKTNKEFKIRFDELSDPEFLEHELHWFLLFLFGACTQEEYEENVASKLNLYNNEEQETK